MVHWCVPSIAFWRESQGLFEAFGQGRDRLGVHYVLAVIGGGSNDLPLILGWLIVASDLLCRFLARRGGRSFKGYEGVIVVPRWAIVEALDVGSLRVVQLHWTAVVIDEVAIVNHSMVCIDCALQGPASYGLPDSWSSRAMSALLVCPGRSG